MKYLIVFIFILSVVSSSDLEYISCDEDIIVSDVEIYHHNIKGYIILVDGQVVEIIGKLSLRQSLKDEE